MSDTKPEAKNEPATKNGGMAGAAPDTPTPANDAAAADAASPGSEAEARIVAIEEELLATAAELAAFRDSAQRQLADMLNQRRRAENDAADARKFGAASFAREMLAIADNLKRALAAAATPAASAPAAAGSSGDPAARAEMLDSLRQGVELIDRELALILERHGIRHIDPKGEKFDPNFHQAMFEVPTAEAEPGTVVEVVQAGYRLHDRLLRPAMVGVAKAPARDAPAADMSDGEPKPE